MHITAARRALWYLKGTSQHWLHYPRGVVATKSQDLSVHAWIQGFTDSDWAGDELTRKSVGGCIFYAYTTPENTNGGPLHPGAFYWQSKTQTVGSLSTLQAEYIACSDAVREAIWVRRLLQDMLMAVPKRPNVPDPPAAVQIGCYNQGALKLIETGNSKQKTKHIDIKYHHVRDEEAKGTVKYHNVKTTDNPADLLTMTLPSPRHRILTGLVVLWPDRQSRAGNQGFKEVGVQ